MPASRGGVETAAIDGHTKTADMRSFVSRREKKRSSTIHHHGQRPCHRWRGSSTTEQEAGRTGCLKPSMFTVDTTCYSIARCAGTLCIGMHAYLFLRVEHPCKIEFKKKSWFRNELEVYRVWLHTPKTSLPLSLYVLKCNDNACTVMLLG